MNSIAIYQELKSGGAWLGAARSWMQSNVKNGDTLTWGSGETVQLPFCKLEELAMRVAIAAVEEERAKQLRSKAVIPLAIKPN
jgi:hypothetical protein